MSGEADKRSVPQHGVTGSVTTAAREACFHMAWAEVWWQLGQQSSGTDMQS